jgi:hypothetical protein
MEEPGILVTKTADWWFFFPKEIMFGLPISISRVVTPSELKW